MTIPLIKVEPAAYGGSRHRIEVTVREQVNGEWYGAVESMEIPAYISQEAVASLILQLWNQAEDAARRTWEARVAEAERQRGDG